MDSVRFGRALGFGARQAAKTLITAADAATAPNPSAKPAAPRPTPSTPQTSPPRPPQPPSPTAQRAASVLDTSRGIARGSRQFGQAVWSPVARLSGVLWLELTGVFFGLFALSAGVAAWKLRDALHPTPANAAAHTHLLLALAVTAVFGYFCLSSFLRARSRERSGRNPSQERRR